MPRFLLYSLLLASVPAWADHRALSVDVAGAWSAGGVAALDTTAPHSTLTLGPAVWLGGRYALTNALELSATAFLETPVTVGHNGVVLHTASGDFSGTLVHQTMRFGGQAGARLVLGMVWRLHLGLELGWSQRSYSGLQMLDDRDANNVIDYGLTLPGAARGSFVVSPLLGVEWAIGDHWSLAVLPRGQLQFGLATSWAVLVPVQFSWSWYL